VFIRYDGATQGAGSASDSAELITIDVYVCVQRIIHRSPSSHWHALSIGFCELPTAAGEIFFAVEKGDRLRLTGSPSQFRNKPQLVIICAERALPDFRDPTDVIFARRGITKNRLCVFAKLMEMILRNVSLPSPEKLIDCFRACVTPVETKFLRPACTLLP
jgi:hypothetical protein